MGPVVVARSSARLGGRLFLALVAASSAAACSSKTAAEFLITPMQENELGAKIKVELEKGTAGMPAIRYLPPGELNSYILDLASKVVSRGKTLLPEFTWSVQVIDDPTQVNAFATPGGYLYVYTGLLRAADNEAEVVGVMGHEVGHVLGRHFAIQLVKTYSAQGLISIVLGDNPNALAELAANVLAKGYLLSHSRDDETEADTYGARLASQAGYDPNGLVTFFAKLEMLQGAPPSILKYLMGHPPPADRQIHVQQVIKNEMLPIGVTNRDKFQMMKTRLPAGLPSGSADGGT